MATIRDVVGDGALRAMQLSDRVQQRSRGQVDSNDQHDPEYVEMRISAFGSITFFLKDIASHVPHKSTE